MAAALAQRNTVIGNFLFMRLASTMYGRNWADTGLDVRPILSTQTTIHKETLTPGVHSYRFNYLELFTLLSHLRTSPLLVQSPRKSTNKTEYIKIKIKNLASCKAVNLFGTG